MARCQKCQLRKSATEDAFSFTGLALGHSVAGFVADLKGRRLPMVLGYLGISLCSLFMTMASGYKSMVLLRVLHGFSCGLGVPPAMSMIAEIMPADWRPFMFITFWSFTAVGETYACSGLVAFMPNLQESCWKQERHLLVKCKVASVLTRLSFVSFPARHPLVP